MQEECAAADEQAAAPAGTAREVLRALAPDVRDDAHPRDLSEGQRLALALAVQLAGRPGVLLLDEPTRGLDYTGKTRLSDLLRTLRAGGRTVLLATHDVEFVAGCADRVILLAGGEVVADAPARALLHDSATFSPQVAKILRPVDVLTVDDVRDLLHGSALDHGRVPRYRREQLGGGRAVKDPELQAVPAGPGRGAGPASAVPLSRRMVLALALASVLGLLAFGWPLVVEPGAALADGTSAPLVLAVVLAAALGVLFVGLGDGGDRRQGGRGPGAPLRRRRGAPARGRRDRRHRDRLPRHRPRCAGVRAGLRVRPRLDHHARVGPADGRRRALATVPDGRGRVGRPRRGRAARTAARVGRGRGARGVRRPRVAGLRLGDEPLLLALPARCGHRDLVRAGRPGGGEPAPVRPLLAHHVARLGPGPCADDGGRRGRPRPPGARRAASGRPSGPRSADSAGAGRLGRSAARTPPGGSPARASPNVSGRVAQALPPRPGRRSRQRLEPLHMVASGNYKHHILW
ncbi:AAA family ATPase [Georgenia sp. SUBG003]|uniref:AAA family ATPase n=1 Tax=Georgenia sp. SUBG003 TaxID=1497974 RepID=UPI003AB3C6A7